MVKVRGPSLSLRAGGSLAGVLTSSSWKGRGYIKKLTVPTNPNTPAQASMRAIEAALARAWDTVPAARQGTWSPAAAADNLSPFNAFCRTNLRRWRSFLGPSSYYPPTNYGFPLTIASEAATGRKRTILVSATCTSITVEGFILFFRGSSPGFATAWDNLIYAAFIPAAGTTYNHVDGPLDPGTYYYNFRGVAFGGELKSEETEVNATIPT